MPPAIPPVTPVPTLNVEAIVTNPAVLMDIASVALPLMTKWIALEVVVPIAKSPVVAVK